MAKDARGLRNNNPGNLKHSPKNRWNGLADPPMDAGGYCVFTSAVYGLRALATLLLAYFDRHHLNTIEGIISRWAPPDPGKDKNPTGRYIAYVAGQMGIGSREELDLHDREVMRRLVTAIVRFENGVMPYGDAELDKALGAAGFIVEKRTEVPASAKVAVGTTTAAGATGTLADQLQDIGGVLQPFASVSKWIAIAFTVVTLGVLLYMVWGMIDRSRREPG